MKVFAVAIFCLTYVLIASRRLSLLPIGRPTGALLGAVLMVATGVLTPRESLSAVDGDTLVLLFGMMLLTAYLELSRFFDLLAGVLIRRSGTPWRLLVLTAILSGGLSAFLVNDTVCLFLTPVIVLTCRRSGLPMGPYLIALATSANIGSAATLVGNPQNMIVGSLSGLPFATFMACAGPAAVVGLAINVALLGLYYRRRLPGAFAAEERQGGSALSPRLAFTLAVTAAVIAGFFAGFHLGYTALAGVLVMVLAGRREPREVFAKVDWTLLVFFASLFIVMDGLNRTGLVAGAWAWSRPHLDLHAAGGVSLFTGLMAAGSNLVSNVPLVILAGPHIPELPSAGLAWILLAFVTTVAGNLTLVGSVANIIVAEGARAHYTLGFVEYLRFGFVSTVVVLAAGVPVVYLMTSLLLP